MTSPMPALVAANGVVTASSEETGGWNRERGGQVGVGVVGSMITSV